MLPFTERIQLDTDERILLVVRKHWFILLRDTIVPVLLFIIPVGVFFWADNSVYVERVIPSFPHRGAVILFCMSLWGLITWLMLFLIWTDYYLDMWTITNRRIIAIDQRGLFRRAVASFRYERLQDINIEINGFIATMLDFGELHAQTASAYRDVFEINGIPNPRAVKALILRAADDLVIADPTSIPAEQDLSPR